MRKGKQYILAICLTAFFLRIILSFFGTLELDFNTFIAWSKRLSGLGLKQFYFNWSDYLPGYLYILWFLGKIKEMFTNLPNEVIYKLPAIISDLLTGYLLFLIVKKHTKEKWALFASLAYLFNPAVFANSSLWGQVDSLTALFSLLAIYFFHQNFLFSAAFLAFGVITKPQAFLAAIVVLAMMAKEKWKIKKAILYIFLSLSVFIFLFLPFFSGGNYLSFIYERVLTTLNQYPYTSVNAFNFWGFWGFWIRDDLTFLPPMVVAVMLTLLFTFVVYLKIAKKKGWEYYLLSVIFLAGFLFFPRMHERHLLSVFAPLVVAFTLKFDLVLVYVGLSFTYLVNLYYSYVWITGDFKKVIPEVVIKALILINLSLFAFLMKKVVSGKRNSLSYVKIKKAVLDRLKIGGCKLPLRKTFFPRVNLSKRLLSFFFIFIVFFSLISRLVYLNKPEKEYFDEVYHAFTARLMLHSDPKAWEWWNPHPEGFAYEWTHPPLAKLGMVLGMKVFGENVLGWRLPGALLGVGSVLLIYFISKEIFKDQLLALLAAFLFSLDGLPLVMSRIGMNDSYLLFFVLLSFFLYLKDKHFLSAFCYGLALASKWSAIWAIPIFLLAHFVFGKKFKLSYLWFVLLPPAVYLLSYAQMFLTGHNFETFIGVQKQMWWYHTRLNATHAYTSSWWSWPLLVRPIYLFVKEGGTTISKIYAMGNPFIFWAGLVGVFAGFYYSFLEKNRNLAFVLFSYLVFFVPWALSPRIMFLYHYLPSIPFMLIALAFVLRKNPKWIIIVLAFSLFVFLYFFPHWVGLPVSKTFDNSYYWFDTWR